MRLSLKVGRSIQLMKGFFFFKSEGSRGAWVPQSVKRPALDFNSGHDLMVPGFKPYTGLCADSVEPAWNPLSSSFSASPQLVLTLSLLLHHSWSLSKTNK